MIKRAIRGGVGRVGVGVDRFFVRLAFKNRGAGKRATRQSVRDRLDMASAFYPEAANAGRLFPTPSPAPLSEKRVRALDGGQAVDLYWPSDYEPLHEQHRRTLARVPETATAWARWLRHDEPAPVLICIHGWGAGQFSIEERAFQAPWLYRRGYDVVLATLPFHARRAPKGRWTPMFPSPDPIRSNEGFAQAMLDLRALIAALRERGAPAIGVTGMSLGGFTTALLATVEPSLRVAIPIIPFASLPELMWDHGRGTTARDRAEDAGITRERFAGAFTAITPLKRPPAMDPERILIIAGERDHVTPPKHARWLHEHFEGSHYASYPGSHLVQWGRGEAFRALIRFADERLRGLAAA